MNRTPVDADPDAVADRGAGGGVEVRLLYTYCGRPPLVRTVTLPAVPRKDDAVTVDADVTAIVEGVVFTPVEDRHLGRPPALVILGHHVDITPERLAAAGWEPFDRE